MKTLRAILLGLVSGFLWIQMSLFAQEKPKAPAGAAKPNVIATVTKVKVGKFSSYVTVSLTVDGVTEEKKIEVATGADAKETEEEGIVQIKKGETVVALDQITVGSKLTVYFKDDTKTEIIGLNTEPPKPAKGAGGKAKKKKPAAGGEGTKPKKAAPSEE